MTNEGGMKKPEQGDAETASANVVAANLDGLRALFPEVFAEGKVDFDKLKQLLGGAVDEREEKYGLNWHGKRRARQLALTPSTGTLRPAPDESVDWDTTQNLMIEGDNLEVLKLLQKSYAGKVKLIYIDPPYNTGKDFVYPDDFRDNIRNYLELTGQVEGGTKITSNPESSGRFHTDWLTMMYPRIKLARDLLKSDGILAISIDDNEVANLRHICDSVFGEECYLGCISRLTGTPTGGGNDALVSELDYLLVYARTPDAEVQGTAFTEDDASIYDREDAAGKYLIRSLRRTGGEDRREDRPTMYYGIDAPDGTTVYPIAPAGYESRWICGKERYLEMANAGLIEWNQVARDGGTAWQVYQKFYLEGRLKQPSNLWSDVEGNKKATRDLKKLFDDQKVFQFPKPVGLLRRVLQVFGGRESSIVMDFFAGSGAFGHACWEETASDAVMRRFVLVQLPEPIPADTPEQGVARQFCESLDRPPNVAELTKERLRRAAKKIRDENPLFAGDLGFRVFKLDSSNIRAWEPKRDDLEQTLLESQEHIKSGRSEQDILYELLLKLGLELTVPIETRAIAAKAVYSIGGGVLMVCLAESVSAEEVEGLANGIVAWHKELAPAGAVNLVFRDSAFADDVAKTNLTAILQQQGLGNVKSV